MASLKSAVLLEVPGVAVQEPFGQSVGLGGEYRAEVRGAFFRGLGRAGTVDPGGGFLQGPGAQVAGFLESRIAFLPVPQAAAKRLPLLRCRAARMACASAARVCAAIVSPAERGRVAAGWPVSSGGRWARSILPAPPC